MKDKPNAGRMWMEVEDDFIPRLRVSLLERAVYCHLVRHTRLMGQRRLRCSMSWLGRGARVSAGSARDASRSLANKGALKIIERSRTGHLIEVLLPGEIAACRSGEPVAAVLNLETADFFEVKELRDAIYRREGGRCFYCRRWLRARTRVLDHVVPREKGGGNCYRNVVACCAECNTDKGKQAGGELLRKLYREGRLSASELREGLRALEQLARGRLKPRLNSAQV